MDLSDYEWLPGVVINVNDPEKRGRVKATVPTWFDTTVMQEEAIPWIVPANMGGYQRFSKLELGSKINVFHRKNTNLEYWYTPMFELDDKTKEIVDDYDSPEVLLSRSSGDSGVYVYYNAKDGLMLKNGDLEVHLTNNKEIHITDQTASIDMTGSNIDIGKQEDRQPGVMGTELYNLLRKLGTDLVTIGGKMPPCRSAVGPDFINAGKAVVQACEEILSKTVKISK